MTKDDFFRLHNNAHPGREVEALESVAIRIGLIIACKNCGWLVWHNDGKCENCSYKFDNYNRCPGCVHGDVHDPSWPKCPGPSKDDEPVAADTNIEQAMRVIAVAARHVEWLKAHGGGRRIEGYAPELTAAIDCLIKGN